MNRISIPRRAAAARALAALLALMTLMAATPLWAQSAAQKLPTQRINAGIHNIDAEIAKTPEQRAIGLMNRASMPANTGMLFIFEQPGTQCFWMKNTLLPLSIAFVADDGRITEIADMKPQTLESHCSAQPVRLVLEMNQGWFAKRGIKAGDRLSGPPFKP